jgi:hypothetical protein
VGHRPAGLKNDALLSHSLEAHSGGHDRRSFLIARRRLAGKLALVAVPNGRVAVGKESTGNMSESMKGF